MKLCGSVFLVIVVLQGPSLVFAEAPPTTGPTVTLSDGGMGGGSPNKGRGEWKKKLGLTDEQAQKLRTAMQSKHTATENLIQQRRQTVDQLRGELQSNAADPMIQATLAQLRGIQKSMQSVQDQFHDSLAGLLTPKQEAQLLLGLLDRRRNQTPRMESHPASTVPPQENKHDELGEE